MAIVIVDYIFDSISRCSESASMKSMAFASLVLAISLVHIWVSHTVVSEPVAGGPEKSTDYWLPDWKQFKDKAGIHLGPDYQFSHLPAKAFSWAPYLKVRKMCHGLCISFRFMYIEMRLIQVSIAAITVECGRLQGFHRKSLCRRSFLKWLLSSI